MLCNRACDWRLRMCVTASFSMSNISRWCCVKIPVKYWSNTGQILVKNWSNTGVLDLRELGDAQLGVPRDPACRLTSIRPVFDQCLTSI